MVNTALLATAPLTAATALEGMATTVLLIGEWLVRQQHQLKQQQDLLEEQKRQISAQQKQIEELNEQLDKLKNRSSQNSSVPPSADQLKKSSDKSQRKKGKKRGPKYNHQGKTRNGFGQPDQVDKLELESCPVCGSDVESVEGAPQKVQQVAELVEQPVYIQEYHRPLYQCPECGWTGYSPMPWGTKEAFSYGGRLCSVVGWLGYGGNLTWLNREYFALTRFGSTRACFKTRAIAG
jgi:DNA-binding protein H-NS/rRNA maturation protein Nop10